jgi:thiol-disulfide isomerase/thioredoxin
MLLPWRRLLSVTTLGLLLLAAFGFSAPQIVSAKLASNDDFAAGDPPLIDLADYKNVIAKYRGKGVLVTFWATWCEPCRNEYPLVVSLAKEYAPQGLVVVGVSLDENSDLNLVRRFLAQSHPGFSNYRQKPGIDADAFYQGVSPDWRGAMPETAFYARDGHLARSFFGERQREAFVDAIRLILAAPRAQNRPGEAPLTGS